MERKAKIRKTWHFSMFSVHLILGIWCSVNLPIFFWALLLNLSVLKTPWLAEICGCLELKWGSLILTAWKYDIGVSFSGLDTCKYPNIDHYMCICW